MLKIIGPFYPLTSSVGGCRKVVMDVRTGAHNRGRGSVSTIPGLLSLYPFTATDGTLRASKPESPDNFIITFPLFSCCVNAEPPLYFCHALTIRLACQRGHSMTIYRTKAQAPRVTHSQVGGPYEDKKAQHSKPWRNGREIEDTPSQPGRLLHCKHDGLTVAVDRKGRKLPTLLHRKEGVMKRGQMSMKQMLENIERAGEELREVRREARAMWGKDAYIVKVFDGLIEEVEALDMIEDVDENGNF